MAWFQVDDGFYDHPKFVGVGMAARGLWVTAGAYCARHLTDGVITARQVRILGGTPAQIRALVGAGLWVETSDDQGAIAYAFHDWLQVQMSRKEILKRRETEAERKRKWREAKADKQRKRENVPTGQYAGQDAGRTRRVRSSQPNPTQPNLLSNEVEREGEGSVRGAGDPSQCDQHPEGTDKPCLGCARARRHREETAEHERTAAAAARSNAARQAAADRAAAIADCDLCDENGYRGTTVCDHTDYTETASRGSALARAAIGAPTEPRFTRP